MDQVTGKNWTQYIRALPEEEQAALGALLAERGVSLDLKQSLEAAQTALIALYRELPEESTFSPVLLDTIGLLRRQARPLQRQAAVRLHAVPPSKPHFAAGSLVSHPLLGLGKIGGEGSLPDHWTVDFFNGVSAELSPSEISLFKPSHDRMIIYPPVEVLQEALKDTRDGAIPFLYYKGELYLFPYPKRIGGRQKRDEFNRKKLAIYARSIRVNGFDIEKAPPVFQLPLDLKNTGWVGGELVAIDGHHRIRSAGKAMSLEGFIRVGGVRVQRVPVRIISEAELRGMSGCRSGFLTPEIVDREFAEASENFGRNFRYIQHPALSAHYAAPSVVITKMPAANISSGRLDYLFPHAGVTGFPLDKRQDNQDGLLRFLDKEMALTIAVMDGLGSNEHSEDAVDIAGNVFISSMQDKADPRQAIEEAQAAVLQFNSDNIIKASRKDFDAPYNPPSTTFSGARIMEKEGKIFVERLGVGDSYQFVLRRENGGWVRRFDVPRHTQRIIEDPKLNLPSIMQGERITSVIGSPDMEVYQDRVEVQAGDFVFLCTDGVMNNVTFVEITKILDETIDQAIAEEWDETRMLKAFSTKLKELIELRQRGRLEYNGLNSKEKRRLKNSWSAKAVLDDYTFLIVMVKGGRLLDWTRFKDSVDSSMHRDEILPEKLSGESERTEDTIPAEDEGESGEESADTEEAPRLDQHPFSSDPLHAVGGGSILTRPPIRGGLLAR